MGRFAHPDVVGDTGVLVGCLLRFCWCDAVWGGCRYPVVDGNEFSLNLVSFVSGCCFLLPLCKELVHVYFALVLVRSLWLFTFIFLIS